MNILSIAPRFQNFFGSILPALFLVLTLGLAGCVSSGSNTASYGGPSVSSASAKRSAATRNVKSAKRDVRAAKKEVKAISKKIAQDTRRLKRKRTSAKKRKAIAKRIKSNKRKLRTAKRSISKANRKLKRAKRAEKRAVRATAAAIRRKTNAEKKIAAAKRRQAADKKRLAAAEKKRDQELAQNEAKRDDPITSRTGGLFSLSDPALKNVSDYAARVDGSFPVAAIPIQKMNKRLLRQEVRYSSKYKSGTLVVDPHSKYLYLIQSGGSAMRYGIGVGKAGFEWSGEAHIGWKQEWPKWTPPAEMIERRPDLEKYSSDNGGMPGGPTNPLGARALYLMQGNVDTLYRLHGTPQWASIGTAASSGCIRLMNQDIIDLYKRVPNGAKVVVL